MIRAHAVSGVGGGSSSSDRVASALVATRGDVFGGVSGHLDGVGRCLDGILLVVTRAAPAPAGTGDAHTTTTAGGTLTVLSTSSITVHNNEHGDVSCTLGPASPRLGDFHVGDHVGMACVDGVLAKLVKL